VWGSPQKRIHFTEEVFCTSAGYIRTCERLRLYVCTDVPFIEDRSALAAVRQCLWLHEERAACGNYSDHLPLSINARASRKRFRGTEMKTGGI
jgi:hypothetical protein